MELETPSPAFMGRHALSISDPLLQYYCSTASAARFQCCCPFLRPVLQGGITCGAIEDPRKSSKAIDERVIINFRDKNGVIARFRDKNVVIVRFCDKNVECLYIYYGVIEE